MREQKLFLESYIAGSPNERKSLLQNSQRDLIEFLQDVAFNVLKNTEFPVCPKLKPVLQKNRVKIRLLARQNRTSEKSTRKLLESANSWLLPLFQCVIVVWDQIEWSNSLPIKFHGAATHSNTVV